MNRERKFSVLIEARSHFAGVGTRRAKLTLNKLAKHDVVAAALRVALEAEDANLSAKRYFGGDCGGLTYSEVHYARKSTNIGVLIEIAKSERWLFGVQPSGTLRTTHIIYFDVPGVGQISWHYTPNDGSLPIYKGVWDQQVNSTLRKLEAAIAIRLGTSVNGWKAA
jgi:hypothetical protein